ncbi:hypothetical protein Zmor_023223 [Zophobas morio]|uniref:Zinc finger PHD-type domain-containing protein n=1 Tax=Zophobas morio TaxID=2755281 RepID=A0AA38HWQ3_9CUCU|nr:hypothetical protein Zmor_023223 [Zophobas morio]
MPSCRNCAAPIGNCKTLVTCDGCTGHIHMSCAGLSDEDVQRVTQNKNKTLKIFCKHCNNMDLRSLLLKLVIRVESIENKLDTQKQEKLSEEIFEEATGEALERMKKAKNIIIHGIPEKTGSIQNRQEEDLLTVSTIIDNLHRSTEGNVSQIKCHRLGKAAPNKTRPLKVIFPGEEQARLILKNKKNLDSSKFGNIKISDDKTPRQLTYLKSLRTTLQNRIDNGEANLTIKYVQGKPTIVTISKNKEN